MSATTTLMPRRGLKSALRTFYDWLEAALAVSGCGTKAGTAVTADETGLGNVHTTVLTFAAQAIALTDVPGTVAYGGMKVYDFPEGAILFKGAVADLAVAKSSSGVNADWEGDFSLGTASAAGDASLTIAEADLIPSTGTPAADQGATTAKGVSTSNEAPKILDGTAAAKSVYLNFLVDDADHDVTTTPCNLVVTGTITISWERLGDK